MTSSATEYDIRVEQCSTHDYFTSPSIRVVVGGAIGSEEFIVHEALICGRSEFFQKAMSGDWKEAKDRTIPLPDDEPSTFALYLKLLYASQATTLTRANAYELQTGKLPLALPAEVVVMLPSAAVAERDECLALSKLYVLAEKLLDETSKKAALIALTVQAEQPSRILPHRLPEPESIGTIYDGTPPNSAARRWLVNLYTDHGVAGSLHNSSLGVYSQQFISDLAFNLIEKRPRSAYLEHKTSENDKIRADLETVQRTLRNCQRHKDGLAEELKMLKKEAACMRNTLKQKGWYRGR